MSLLSRLKLGALKHGPDILLVTGVAEVVVSTIIACKKCAKATTIIEEHKADIYDIHEDQKELEEAGEYRKELTKTYISTGVKLATCYLAPIVIGATGLVSIGGAYGVIRKRYYDCAAACATLGLGFSAYRKNVVDRFGRDTDISLLSGGKIEKVEEEIIDEDGKKKKIKTEKVVVEEDSFAGCSPFAKIFGPSCEAWTKEPEANRYFLGKIEKFVNQRFKQRGYMLLNDVYADLDFAPTQAGMVHGWIYDYSKTEAENWISFGIFDAAERNERFINGLEPVVILDFNVQGVIYDRFPNEVFGAGVV